MTADLRVLVRSLGKATWIVNLLLPTESSTGQDLLLPTKSSTGQDRRKEGGEERSFQHIHGTEFRKDDYRLLLEEGLPALTCFFAK